MRTALLTVKQVAEQLGVHYKTACELVAGGEIPAHNIGSTGNGKRYRIRQSDLDRWLQSRRTTAA
jgi:excisionase family DNA binding protein